MRSVFTFLPNCKREEVESLLGFSIPGRDAIDPEWEAIVSVDYYVDAELEMPEIWWLIQEKLRSKPLCLSADISGRMKGIKEATAFCIKMLEHFGGYAMDDYSDHLWTLEELRNGGTYKSHPFFDSDGWYEEQKSQQSAHKTMNQEMVLCIPGPWRDRIEFLKAIISLPPAGEFMFAGEVLAHPKANDHVQIEFCDPDPKMLNAFQIAGQGRLSEEALDLIGQHQSVVYLILPINALEEPERILKFSTVIQKAGGRAVKVESSGLAHGWNRWLDLLSGSTFDRYCSVVTLIGDSDDYYSCGMHHFGLPECSFPRSFDPVKGADIMNRFNMYQIVEKPELASGHTFSLSAESMVFRLNLVEDFRHEESHLFHNPHGVWHLAPLSTQ